MTTTHPARPGSITRRVVGLVALSGLAAVWAPLPRVVAAWNGCYGVYHGPVGISPIDTPLRYYYIPRRPAWGGPTFHYQVEPPAAGTWCDRSCGPAAGDECEADTVLFPYGPDADAAPLDFERLGLIRNDSLFEATPPAAR